MGKWVAVATEKKEDGSGLLQPAVAPTEAQREYETNPDLRALLARAAKSPTVHRAR